MAVYGDYQAASPSNHYGPPSQTYGAPAQVAAPSAGYGPPRPSYPAPSQSYGPPSYRPGKSQVAIQSKSKLMWLKIYSF